MRVWLGVWLCAMCLPAVGVKALDADGDGMSDVWQMTYGVAAEHAFLDPDEDGALNIEEAQAGTEPFNATRSPVLRPSWENGQAATRWTGVAYMRYRVFGGTNLVEWTQSGSERVGSGVDESDFALLAAGPIYRRVLIRTPYDTDGDELADWEEFLLGTEITLWDSDEDGMPDGWEFRYQLDPFRDDSGEDLDGDGVTNLEEYQGGTTP